MYLLYDVLQLRNSCRGNSLLIRRTQWTSVTQDLKFLNHDRLRRAAEEIVGHHVPSDPLIRRLLKNITAIGAQVPGSFFPKLQMRAELRGLIAREGMPAFWMTISPSDLQNPLVLRLAGLQYVAEPTADATMAIKCATATSDPVAVARFFHHTCKAVLDGLLGGNSPTWVSLGRCPIILALLRVMDGACYIFTLWCGCEEISVSVNYEIVFLQTVTSLVA